MFLYVSVDSSQIPNKQKKSMAFVQAEEQDNIEDPESMSILTQGLNVDRGEKEKPATAAAATAADVPENDDPTSQPENRGEKEKNSSSAQHTAAAAAAAASASTPVEVITKYSNKFYEIQLSIRILVSVGYFNMYE